jgi:4-aminobutyrate aminotransferase-like enzyme/Ser/Thr protein kinase RdoA (MazF antagonist)
VSFYMVSVRYQYPEFTEQDALRLALQYYGLQGEARALPSERDQNFHIKTDDGRELVLKIANHTEQRDLLDLQNRVMKHLSARAPEIRLPRVCNDLSGNSISAIRGKDGAMHFMRLLTWVPGRLLATVSPHTAEMLHSLGRALGAIDRALADFDHPSAHRELKWDLKRAAWIREYLHHIKQMERRAMVERFLSDFDARVAPALSSLRSSVIYNDANDYNVLVDPQSRQVTGIIDFGDMTHTAVVCELAIGAAYAMLDKPDPLAAAASVVAGYNEVFPLTAQELETLFSLICARLIISVTNSAYQRTVEPENDYLIISEKPAWELLEKLAGINNQLAHFTFRHACGLTASPNSPVVAQWLEDNADRLSAIVEPELAAENILVFDFSIGSREIGNLAEMSDTEAVTNKLFSRLRAAKASVGIGRYDEARPFYTSDVFRSEGAESRTVHLGLDLFMEAGSAVFAPLDGVVHSFRNNAAHLDYGPTIILEHRTDEGLAFYTLYGHLSEDSLDGLSEGMEVKRGDCIARIGAYPINGDWPPHLHFQIITDLLGQRGDFPGVAAPSQRGVWLSISPDPNLVARIPRELLAKDEMSGAQILAAREKLTGKNLSVSYNEPLHIVRGSMQYLYDEGGRAYLDAVNNVPHVGHCHPRVVRAAQEQMAVLNTNTRYLHENLVRYADRLCATLPEPLRVCFLVNSGSEANELALRLARAHTRSKETIVLEAAYHGNTASLIEISPYKHDGPGGEGRPPYVHKVALADVYRGPYKKSDPQAGARYAQLVAEEIERIEGRVSAFIFESLPGCAGQIVLPDGYLREAFRHVRDTGGVCIADEVQVGFGRVGTHFWGFETQGVIPDIVTLGKPIGNGHPMGAVITTRDIADSFANGMEYFNTFGGNPVSCAVGMAVLDVIGDERLQENALRTGKRLIGGLRELMKDHRLIGDVRGLGLYAGVELVTSRATLAPADWQAAYVANRCRERGVLLSTDGPLHNVLKIKPPMVFDESNADFLIETLDAILKEDFLRID